MSDLLPDLYTAVISPITSIFDHVSNNAIDARTFATLQSLYARTQFIKIDVFIQACISRVMGRYTWNSRSLGSRQGLGSHQSSEGFKLHTQLNWAALLS